MPAKSKAQQRAAGAALSAKRGDTPKSKLKGASKQMAESMTEAQLEDFASTKRKGKKAGGKKAQAGKAADAQSEVAVLKKELAMTKLDLEELKLQMDLLLSGVSPADVKTKLSEQRETQLRAEIQKNEASIRRELEELKSILSEIIRTQKK